ncbi:BRCA1-associated RING domain protein 1-like isoform X2 [Ruditapes philippinarum]|nr:BRCA1-associated RING domain protein 1-like isoform X2 [Ruditapes philippinarum]
MYETTTPSNDHVTNATRKSEANQKTENNEVTSLALDSKTSRRKRKTKVNGNTKTSTECLQQETKPSVKKSKQKSVSSDASENENVPSKRRKSVPIDQTTMTQFYDYDEDSDNVNEEIKIKENGSKGLRTLKTNKKPVTLPKTRLRHSLDSNIGKDLKSDTKSPSTKSKSVQRKKGKKTDKNESILDVSLSDTGSIGQRTPVSERSKFTRISTEASGSPKLKASTPKGRRNLKPQTAQSPALNKRNAKGETPLQVAAIKNDKDKVKQLLGDGANPNVRDNAGWTPLHEACNHGYVEIAKLLLDHGAMINIPGLENDTPLHDAINNGRVDCVKLLVSRGASLILRNMHGQTPKDLAVTNAMKKALDTPVISSNETITSQVVDVMEYQTPCLTGTGLSREEKVILQKAASQLQVKLIDEVTPEVTHIVTMFNNEGMCPRTIKIVQGILLGKWILNMEWLETCTQVGSLVCEEAFEAQGTSLFPHAHAPYKGRMNRKQQLPGLFDGCHFYFHGSFEYANPTKEDFMNMVTIGGGKLLTREPKPGHLDITLTVPYHADAVSELATCCVYLVHEPNVNYPPIRTKHMCSVPTSWIMDCVANFSLMELPTVT